MSSQLQQERYWREKEMDRENAIMERCDPLLQLFRLSKGKIGKILYHHHRAEEDPISYHHGHAAGAGHIWPKQPLAWSPAWEVAEIPAAEFSGSNFFSVAFGDLWSELQKLKLWSTYYRECLLVTEVIVVRSNNNLLFNIKIHVSGTKRQFQGTLKQELEPVRFLSSSSSSVL